jgi:hypothetical protein
LLRLQKKWTRRDSLIFQEFYSVHFQIDKMWMTHHFASGDDSLSGYRANQREHLIYTCICHRSRSPTPRPANAYSYSTVGASLHFARPVIISSSEIETSKLRLYVISTGSNSTQKT